MKQLFAYLTTWLIGLLGPSVKHILIALGLGYATYTGLDAALDGAKNYVFANLSGLPSNAVAILGLLKVDKAVNVVFSAFAVRAVLAGFSGGTRKSLKFNSQ